MTIALVHLWEVGTCPRPLSEPHTAALLSWRGSELNFKNLKTKQYPFKRYIQLLLSSRNEAHVYR